MNRDQKLIVELLSEGDLVEKDISIKLDMDLDVVKKSLQCLISDKIVKCAIRRRQGRPPLHRLRLTGHGRNLLKLEKTSG